MGFNWCKGKSPLFYIHSSEKNTGTSDNNKKVLGQGFAKHNSQSVSRSAWRWGKGVIVIKASPEVWWGTLS